MLQRLLLLPLLAPLLAVLLVGALNPRPWVALQLLVWRTPAWPLGAWIGLAAAGGGALSAGATALALRTGGGPPGPGPRRSVAEVIGRRREAEPWPEDAAPSQAGRNTWGGTNPAAESWFGPSRAPTDPPPTVSVPFRILRRGSAGSARPDGPARSAPASAGAPTGRASAAQAAASVTATGDGWDEPSSDDW
ncbi:hypothetical protein [Vulcanococcus limneticus]|uniref:hypothetical protein n=1 Tax=Vulcanococcus limneticus TaxID=2170428 RepID=UPI00398BD146